MSKLMRTILVALLAIGPFATATGQDLAAANIKSLDGQVQEIKSDVLGIASELNNLEERLLYPSNTQLSVFVALDETEDIRLDSVQIEINGELATHYIYSFKELEALQKGGVQRLYTGNVTTGEHQLNVTIMGKRKNGADFSESGSFSFSKGVKPKTLGLTLSGSAIQVGNW